MVEPATDLLTTDVVTVAGPDAGRFLQSQLSQDVDTMAVGAHARAFLLEPDGKVAAWGRLTRISDTSYTFVVDPGAGPTVAARLARFKLRTDVDITVTDGPPVPPEWRRIATGVPAMGREITPSTIPAELGPAVIGASVSFTKGCYTGQELVARVDSRGNNVPRPVRSLHIEGVTVPPTGASVVVGDDEVGVVTSAASHPDDGVVALATVARRVVPPAQAQIRWNGGNARALVSELVTTFDDDGATTRVTP